MENEDRGILFAWRFDADGARRFDPGGPNGLRPDAAPFWIHLDRSHPRIREWLEQDANLDPVIVDTLLEEETRPRLMPHAGGLLANLRGVNLNPGADPEDMVSVRMWIDAGRVISMRGPRLMAADDVSTELAAGRGPHTTGGVLAALAAALVERTRPTVSDIEDVLDAFEEQIIDESTPDPSTARISAVRRRAIELRRYLAPQREVMIQLANAAEPWLAAEEKLQLRHVADHITRLVEDLDAARERGAVTHEEASERLSLRMNRNMYLLSVVAAVFLPLSFVTGLLGINVAGIPGAEAGWAFLAVCISLVLLLIGEIWYLRRRHWLG